MARLTPLDIHQRLAQKRIAIDHVAVRPLRATLRAAFPIASDLASKLEYTDNVLVTVVTQRGTVGRGEGAPFEGISGDTQTLLLEDLARVTPHLAGTTYAPLNMGQGAFRDLRWSAARAALEMAMLDAAAQEAGQPLARFLNPSLQDTSIITDMTIPLVEPSLAAELAAAYAAQGFWRVKIKVGNDVDAAIARVQAVASVYAATQWSSMWRFLIDANEKYSDREAITLLGALDARGLRPAIFEQPVPRADHRALGRVAEAARNMGVFVVADESVYTLRDAETIARASAADGINLKLMKHGGIGPTLRIIECAQVCGLKLMFGCMLDTRLGISAAAHLAAAIGGVDWADLDSVLLLEADGLRGGITYRGPELVLPDTPGLGVELQE